MSAPDLTYRFATAADVGAVTALIELAYRGAEAATGWTNETDLLVSPRSDADEVRRLVDDPDSRFLLAEASTELVACVLLQRGGEECYFGMFAVDPRLQAGGIGSAVVAASEDAARELWSSQAMTMSVISVRTELIAWYVRRGFELTGTSEPFPFGDKPALRTDFDLVHLRKPL